MGRQVFIYVSAEGRRDMEALLSRRLLGAWLSLREQLPK